MPRRNPTTSSASSIVLSILALLLLLYACTSAPIIGVEGKDSRILSYRRVHLVDHVWFGADDERGGGTANYLFRGNMPKTATNEFAYDNLVSFMARRAAEANVAFPSRPEEEQLQLLVISLGSIYNKPDTEIEEAYFAAHPERGTFENWSFYHRYESPAKYTAEQIRAMVTDDGDTASKLWGPDDVPRRVKKIRQIMETPLNNNKSLAIYVHCETGCDRTSEFLSSYELLIFGSSSSSSSSSSRSRSNSARNNNNNNGGGGGGDDDVKEEEEHMNITAIIEEDAADCGRPPNPSAAFQISWFCYYVHYAVDARTDDPTFCQLPHHYHYYDYDNHYDDDYDDYDLLAKKSDSHYRHHPILNPTNSVVNANDRNNPVPGPVVIPIYAAVFLDDKSQATLLNAFPAVHTVVYAQHSTLAFRPDNVTLMTLPWGRPIYVTVVGYAQDENGQAVVVELSARGPGRDDLPSEDPIKHVTISCAEGVGPVYSLDLLKAGYTHLAPQQYVSLEGAVGAWLSNGTLSYEYHDSWFH